MTKYMYLFRGGDDEISAMSPEQTEAHMGLWRTWMGTLGQTGKLVGGEPLKTGGKVMRDGGKLITDGPFMEGKELVGGYVVVNVESEDEAVEMAKGCPVLNVGGSVEVREIPVFEL